MQPGMSVVTESASRSAPMDRSYLAFLAAVRQEEFERVRQLLPGTGRLLDFGAGAGHQARLFQRAGYHVDAVDIAASQYRQSQVFAVREYDGRTLPFPDGSFDIIFSSNALEHVANLAEVIAEMKRVAKPGSLMIHVLPSSCWRLWTTFAEFAAVPRNVAVALAGGNAGGDRVPLSTRVVASLRRLARPLRFRAHGEDMSALHELYTFSKVAWRRRFEAAQCEVLRVVPLRLFYTGEALFGLRLSLQTRTQLAAWLGSVTVAWLVRPR
jgi:SAM-dependent methyltransferase